ncbi:MAG: hypothetical protein KKA62_05020 [Nanoarchaeota archaeon]|nr:hypothetical protein [Nanoarchaeota archaeon]MBU1644041.1 hypothetical protein [Nanoarchaeota archaeon]MBU1977283.1 hypothetical protein [Nanoarchaeota archaeon]
MKKKPLHKRILGHTWDETLVIAVMILAALGILILIANYATTTGQAYASVVPSEGGLVKLLNSAEVLQGSGKMKCSSSLGCGKLGKTCILAKLNGQIRNCEEKIEGNYYCVCASPERIS